jgi:Caspase domain
MHLPFGSLLKSVVLLFAVAFVCVWPTNAQPKPAGQQSAQERGIRKEVNAQAARDTRGVGLVSTLPGKAKRFALVIGIDRYNDPQVTGLTGAANDARLLADALVRYAGFPADQVILLASNQPIERQPTRGNILRKLSNLAAIVPKDGLLLFSFAGHGMERSNQAFLLPADAQISDDVNLLEQTAINVVQIKDWIRKTGVNQVLLLLDACRNDPAAGRASADNLLTKNYMRGFDFDVRNREVQAFATLYATDVGLRAYEAKEQRHGYFTLALVEGLQGKAANDKGEVTLQSLVSYLEDTVPRRVLLDLGQGRVQRPHAVVEGYRADELVLSVKDERTAAAAQADAQAKEQQESGSVSISTSARPEVETKPLPEQSDETADEGGLLIGTVWRGLNAETGEYMIEFLKDGKLHYTYTGFENGKQVLKTVNGTWHLLDNELQISIADFSAWLGTIEGNVIKGEASNADGNK